MKKTTRRNFLKFFLSASLFTSLTAAYGSFAAICLRFLYPLQGEKRTWVYVARTNQIKVGGSMSYKSPGGMSVEIVRHTNTGKTKDFLALSNICPHLGCRVRWEVQNKRFFCPCHNGVFNTEGKATAGPPSKANQSLKQFPLKVKKGLLYILINTDKMV
jgi:Rieske Fe-S protein